MHRVPPRLKLLNVLKKFAESSVYVINLERPQNVFLNDVGCCFVLLVHQRVHTIRPELVLYFTINTS